jgi:hypothetical protein
MVGDDLINARPASDMAGRTAMRPATSCPLSVAMAAPSCHLTASVPI